MRRSVRRSPSRRPRHSGHRSVVLAALSATELEAEEGAAEDVVDAPLPDERALAGDAEPPRWWMLTGELDVDDLPQMRVVVP